MNCAAFFKSKRRNYVSDRTARTELVDSAGRTVLSWTGAHFKGRAGTILSVGETRYAFPVSGSKHRAKTVMSAIEIGGSRRPIAEFRLTCGWYRAAQGTSLRNVEVVVAPDSISTHHLPLMLAVASPLLGNYFTGGG